MSERTCEIDGKIFEAFPCDDAAYRELSLCEGCAGDDNPEVCIQLADCLIDNVIWVEKV